MPQHDPLADKLELRFGMLSSKMIDISDFKQATQITNAIPVLHVDHAAHRPGVGNWLKLSMK